MRLLHVDEVTDDQAANVPQSQLARDLVRGFEIRLQNRFLHVASAFVAAGVHVDGDQRFGFVDHDVTPAFQPDLTMKRVIDLFLHAKRFEDGRSSIVKLKPVPRAPRNLTDPLVDPVERGPIVANHFINLVGQKIAHRPVHQIRLLKNAAGSGFVFDQFFDPGPLLD